jgi:hypothetical protein
MRFATLLMASALASSTFAAPARATATPSELPIINDDYARARAEANRRHLPIFVEVWAPW